MSGGTWPMVQTSSLAPNWPSVTRLVGWFGTGYQCPLGRTHLSPVYMSAPDCIAWDTVKAGLPADTETEWCKCGGPS